MKKFLFPKKVDYLLFIIWVPIFSQLLMLPIFSWINNAFVGHFGTKFLAAVAIGYNFINAAMGLFYFLTVITTSSVAFYKGAGKMKKAMKSALDGIILGVVFGIIVTIILEIFTEKIVLLFKIKDAFTIGQTISFSRAWELSLTPIFVLWACQGVLKGLQKVKIIAVITIATISLEIILNAIFLFVFKLGIKSLGYGCTIANSVAVIFILIPIIKEIKKSGLKNYKFKYKHIKDFIADSIPLSIRSAVIWIVILVGVFATSSLGETYVSAMQICDSIISFAMFTYDALGGSSQTLVGQALGAKKKKRTVTIMNRAKRLSFLFLVPVSIFIIILSIFLPIVSTNDIKVMHLVLITCIGSILTAPLQSYTFTFDGVLNGFEEYKFLMKSSVISMVIGVLAILIAMQTINHSLIKFIFIFLGYDIFFLGPRAFLNYRKIKKLKIRLTNS